MFKLCFKTGLSPQLQDLCLAYNEKDEVIIKESDAEFAVTFADLESEDSGHVSRESLVESAIFLGLKLPTEVGEQETPVWLLRRTDQQIATLIARPELSIMSVRQVTRTVDSESLLFRLYRGLQIHRWLDRYKFCPGCAQLLVPSLNELGLECHGCGSSNYPTISPAMIVAITRNAGSEILLVQPRNRTGDWWSLVAGYCEAGESLEQTVEREVYEETGLRVKNIRYVESQAWPFGHSLMLGFTAEYTVGELLPDPTEIENAAWFSLENLPAIPRPPSIGNRLISLVASRKPGSEHGFNS